MAVPDDDPSAIPNEVRLFRRISPAMIVYDGNQDRWRATSQNFQDSKDGTPMSVFAENIADEHGELPAHFLLGRWSDWGLAAVVAGHMRELGQRVYPDPHNQDAEDRFESHSAVAGNKKAQNIRKRMSDRAELIIVPKLQS